MSVRSSSEGRGNQVQVVKSGYITKYPYYIERRVLTIPNTHTTGQTAHGDIWIRFNNRSFDNNNFYLTTWENCAMIQTGDSDSAATPDEQMVIANVLFYLGQVTQESDATIRTAEDLTPPDKPTVKLAQKYGQKRSI